MTTLTGKNYRNMSLRLSIFVLVAIYCLLQISESGAQSAAIENRSRTALRAVVDLASSVGSEELETRERALDMLYEEFRWADGERKLASRAFAQEPDRNFVTLTASRGEAPVNYLAALGRSFARFQGAEQSGDHPWAARHMTAARQYASLAARALITQSERDDAEVDKLRSRPFAVRRSAEQASSFWERVKLEGLTSAHLALLAQYGVKTAEIDSYYKKLLATPVEERGISIIELYEQVALGRRMLANALEQFAASHTLIRGPLSQTYLVGNPHDRAETVDLFIRRASVPPEWTLSIVDVVLPSGEKSKNPQIQQVEAGRHYRVRLPAKGEIRVSTVLVATGAVADNTTARWAVEGKIGDKLLGGIVQEMHVPAYIPDLKLPAVGSVDTPAPDGRPRGATVFKWPPVWISAGLALLLGAVVWLVFFWRRRRARAREA